MNALLRASQGNVENAAPPKPRHHEGCRQERDHHAVKRRGGAPAHRTNRPLDARASARGTPRQMASTARDNGRGGRAPGREELWTVRHHLEDRLSDGDRSEPEQRRASFERHLVALPDTRDDREAADDWANERLRGMARMREGPMKTVLRPPAKMRTATTAPYRVKSGEGSDRSDTRGSRQSEPVANQPACASCDSE